MNIIKGFYLNNSETICTIHYIPIWGDILMEQLLARIEQLEYHQKLLINIIRNPDHEFDKLVIENNLSEREVKEFFSLCDEMSKEVEKQKAEKFVYHAPLFVEFRERLHPKLKVEEVVEACLKQNLYPELMQILKLNIR